MKLGSPLRKYHSLYSEPKKPKPGTIKYRHVKLAYTQDRAHYFPGYGADGPDEEDYEEDDENLELSASRHSLSLKEVNDLVKSKNLDEKDVYFTASFADDYLVLEVVHITKMSEQDILDEYNKLHQEWVEQEKAREADIVAHNEREIARLQEQLKSIKKKQK